MSAASQTRDVAENNDASTAELIGRFAQLPRDALHLLLDYIGTVVFRHGRYMNRLAPDDFRKRMIQCVAKPTVFSTFAGVMVSTPAGNLGIVYRRLQKTQDITRAVYHVYLLTYWTARSESLIRQDPMDRARASATTEQYVYDLGNNRWTRSVEYTM